MKCRQSAHRTITQALEYIYDAWGKVLSVTGTMANGIGSYNPICYRGYYYDIESGFYYLKSRFYDPNTGKFLNADSVSMLITGEKAYTYCENNPVNFSDPEGSTYANRPMCEYFNVNAWSDTFLHVGLSLDQSTIHDYFWIFKNWRSVATTFVFAAYDLYYAVMDSISEQELSWFSYFLYENFRFYYKEVEYAFKDYNFNVLKERELNITGIIYGQDMLSSFFYRGRSANSNACGVVAIYNALVLLGKKVSISDTLFLIEIEDVTKTRGTNTMKMLSDRYNYKCEITDEADEFYEWSEVPGRILVAAHWNDEKKKADSHATSAYVVSEGVINIYNFVNSSVDAKKVNKWTDEISKERFIKGAYVYE